MLLGGKLKVVSRPLLCLSDKKASALGIVVFVFNEALDLRIVPRHSLCNGDTDAIQNPPTRLFVQDTWGTFVVLNRDTQDIFDLT